MTKVEIARMSVLERRQIMEAIGNSLTRKSAEIKSPKWHEKILSDRKEKIANGNANFISLRELGLKNEN